MGANNVGYMIVTLEQLRASMGVHRVHIDKGLIWDGKDCCFSKLYEVNSPTGTGCDRPYGGRSKLPLSGCGVLNIPRHSEFSIHGCWELIYPI